MPKGRSQTAISESTFENTLIHHHDTIPRLCLSSDNEDIIPISIQLFLWRQSSPFLKQKFGHLTDASSIIFDQILVQNMLYGLSPSLTDALSSIPRWLLIKAAFPHVMHACSSLIEHNLHSIRQQSLSSILPSLLVASSPSPRSAVSTQLQVPSDHPTMSIENQSLANHAIDIRLFRTLHHLILNSNENNDQLLSLNTIELFIYLFIPYIQTYFHTNEKEFLSSSNLIQGMQLIWQPLFEYQQPNIRIFNSFVKPIILSNDQQEQISSNQHHPVNESISEQQSLSHLTNQISTNASIVKHEEVYLSLFQPKINIEKERKTSTFIQPDSDTETTTAAYNSITDLSSYGIADNKTKIQAPIVHMSSIYSVSDLSRLTLSPQSPALNRFNIIPGISPRVSISSVPSYQQPPNIPHTCLNPTSSISKTHTSECLLLATYFDVGIIRTLFCSSWLADGYIWCLEYLHKRMIDISDKILSDALTTGILAINILRFKSLSIPQINIINEQNYSKYLKKNYFNEQITNDIIEQQSMMTTTSHSIKQPTTLLNIPFNYSSGKGLFSQKYNNFHKKIREKQLLTRSKIYYIDEDGIEHLDLANTDQYNRFGTSLSSSKSNCLRLTDPTLLLFKTSIINTTDTIRQSTDVENNTRKLSGTSPITNLNAMKTYSVSDSEINYKFLAEIKEAPSSRGYINRNGTINFSVVLAGIHAVICKEHHLKVCELVMNILDVLFGLNVISTTEDDIHRKQLSNNKNNDTITIDERENEHIEEWLKQMNVKEDEKFQLAVDIILRILKRLGCSNCQSRGRSFNADQLRGKVRVSLNKLRLLNQHRFEKCFLNFATNGNLDHIFDILHALCGYCAPTTIGLAHYAPYISATAETHPSQTYSNNFGNTHLNTEPQGIDGFILNIIFKPFVTRLNMMGTFLLSSENITLYNECRSFLIYMKDNHGGIFRLAIFSSLIDPERKLKIARQNDNRIRISLNNELSDDIDENNDQQLQTLGTKQGQSSIRIRRRTRSLTEVDEHSLYAHQEESLYVDLTLVRMGLLRLNFILEVCPPGSIPDPQFLHSLLFLDAPVISKAAFLIECAYYVRRCSLGQWPEWMRMNKTTYRLNDTGLERANGNKNIRLTKMYQAAAGRMFYMWGEALSSQLEAILDIDQQQNLWNNDETYEDYYNEAIINRSSHDCPYSLQLIVCLLLYEITTFLRETYETLPKLSSLSATGINGRQQRPNHCRTVIDTSSGIVDKHPLDGVHMNSIISQTSNQSTGSVLSSEQPPIPSQMLSAAMINMNPLATERHISFAANTEYDSNESNHTIVVINDDDDAVGITNGNTTSMPVAIKKTGSLTSSTGKTKLIRRTSAKFRKPSIRRKDAGKNYHRSSVRGRRRSYVSNLSIDTDGHPSNIGSSTIEPKEENSTSPEDELDQRNFDNIIKTRPFPWIKTVIRIFNNINLTCNHQIKCLSTCYNKQTKSCENLLKALIHMYQLSSIQTNLKPNDTALTNKQGFSNCLFDEQTADSHVEKDINAHFNAISTYLKKQVGPLIQIPLMILCKSSVLLEDEHYSQVLRLSWELLLDRNEELSACAATVVILTAARAGHLVDTLIHTEMENSSGLIRYNAILRFELLWRFRYQFWIRLEEDAHSMMKILPPSIEFVLPSAALGIANLQVVDPPWMPHVKTRFQKVALNQDEFRAVVTTSKTRKKHQQEFIHSALMTEEISKRVARENFTMSTVSMLQAASFEPLLHQSRDEDEEGYGDDDRVNEMSVQLFQAQGTFPSVLGAAIFRLVEMLEDDEIMENGATVSGAARKALWTCLLEEPTLLIRFFFEKLSHKERRRQSLQSLHRLMIYLTDIPPQFAHAIFNYVLGLLISMVRSPIDGSQELFISGLTLFWQIIPYVHGLVLKDLKQILRKEQAEMMILITGNIPSTKKVVIHGPDASQIPTQSIISEDTQFSNILQEALEFFGIPESKRDRYHLIDIKTQQIRIPDTYVRDFYFFRRNIYPQLSLVHMDVKQSQRQLEQASIYLKTIELSKVLFARYLLENTPVNQIQNCITFFYDEIIKSPFFPRKQLESDYNLYKIILNKELFNLDMLHKYNWIKLISCIFFNMDGKTSTTSDITQFLPIINGSFILHCEDLVMLRFCLATYINIVKHFRHIFATNGYLLIMPTFLRVYSNNQSNPMLRKTIEYCCRQFFILHRIPFILQMLGSIAQLIDFDEQIDVININKIQSISVVRLLMALEQTSIDAMRDDYSILELVMNDSLTTKIVNATPATDMTGVAALGQGIMMAPTIIESLDFCYTNDETTFTLLSCFDVCVTVVAYAPDSIRSLQMLGVIDILLPKYFEYLKNRTNKNDIQKQGLDEMKIIEKLSIAFRTLIHSSESLTRTFIEPKSDTPAGGYHKHSRGSYRSPSIVPDEDSMNRFIDDRKNTRAQDTDERKSVSEFRWPRNVLLSILSNFIHFSTERLKELFKLLKDPTLRIPELLDVKSHIRLADIAHALLKLASFDPLTISCRGIQNYFQKLSPYTNWNQEQLRATLNLLLRRIDRMFSKICKKPVSKRWFDWEATVGILNGIYLTIDRQPYLAYLPNFKALVFGCITLILNENVVDSNQNVSRSNTATFPKEFSQTVIKLVGRYLLAIKHQPNLETLTSYNWSSGNTSSTLNHLLHFLLPLMFSAGSGRKDAPKIHSIDISYIITILIGSIKSPVKLASTMGTQGGSSGQIADTGKQYLTVVDTTLPISGLLHKSKSIRQLKDLLQTVSLLGFKILMIAFDKELKREWHRIIPAIKSICNKQSNISSHLLSFIDFMVTHKPPIYIILRPFLLHYMHSATSENDHDFQMITNIQQKLVFKKIPPAKSTGEILNGLMQELNQLKMESTEESKRSGSCDLHPISTGKVRFDTEALEQMKNHDSITTTDEQSNRIRTMNTNRFRRQPLSESSSSNGPLKKRTERIRGKEALDILETYHARYRTRCSVSDIPTKITEDLPFNYVSSMTDETGTSISTNNSRLQSPSNSHSPLSLLRSVGTANDRSSSTIDKDTFSQSTINNQTTSKLRTFWGLKRNAAHLDKARITKDSCQSNISSEPDMTYDATKEMNNLFRPIRQVSEQHSIRIINEQTSDFIDDEYILDNNTYRKCTSSIPLTEFVPKQTESHTKIWISHLSNTSSTNDIDDESKL